MTRHLTTNEKAIEVGLEHLASLAKSLTYVSVRSFHRGDEVSAGIVSDQESITDAVRALRDVEGAWPDANEAKRAKLATEQRRVIARFDTSKYAYYS